MKTFLILGRFFLFLTHEHPRILQHLRKGKQSND